MQNRNIQQLKRIGIQNTKKHERWGTFEGSLSISSGSVDRQWEVDLERWGH